MNVYQVRDWGVNFENDRSRQRAKCSFVCVPNKQHGMGFSRIMAEPDGAAIYGIWHCIIGACSQQLKRAGWLTDNGESAGSSWGAEDLALKFRRPVAEIERALTVLASNKVNWLILHDHRVVTTDSPHCDLEEKRREEKRRERREEKRSAIPQFSETPTWTEFWEYCISLHCGLTAEWYARDKFLAADADNWKGKSNWRAYACRCRDWWRADGSPKQPKQNGQSFPVIHHLTDATFDCRTPEEIAEQEARRRA